MLLSKIFISQWRLIKHQHCMTRLFSSVLNNDNLLKNLKERNLISEAIPENPEIGNLLKSEQCIYAGFDPTSDGLHFGNLLILLGLLHFARNGHKVICLIGNATAKIGDPSDKNSERPKLAPETIAYNTEVISSTISRIFAHHYKYYWIQDPKNEKKTIYEPIILKNFDWYKNYNVIDFISTVGRSLRLTDMLGRKFVVDRQKSREGLSYTEFSYQMFQGYDWFHLLNQYNCRFQLGASDQIGNFHSGIHLARKMKNEQVYGLSMPLILDTDGNKYGKSEQNPIWLNREKRSYFDFYQFFVRLPDKLLEQFLKQFTFLTTKEIEKLMQKRLKTQDPMFAHKILAEHITKLVHGEEGLKVAQMATKIFYDKNIEAVSSLSHDQLNEVFLPEQTVIMYLEPGETTLLDVALKLGAFEKEMLAIQMIQAGGLFINGERVKDAGTLIQDKHILSNSTSLIRIGKKRFYIIKWQ